MWFGVAPRMYFKKSCVWKELFACSTYDNCFKFNSQHNWGDLYDHLMRARVFTLIMNKIFIRDPKMMRKLAMASI